MHISFLHYMEELWNETGNVIAQYWLRTLRTIEPTFIQFAHHIENVFWEGSKKVLGMDIVIFRLNKKSKCR